MTVTAESGAHHAPANLLKILGVTFGVAVTIGQTIGSGILRSPSIVASEVPGVAVIMGLWVLGALQVMNGANIVAELGTMLPKSGGVYVFARRAWGDVGGLIVGWSDWLANLAGAAAASVSFAEFLPALWPQAGTHKIAVALALQIALYAANVMGLREGRAVQNFTSFFKTAMLIVFVIAAAVFIAPSEPQTALSSPAVFRWANIILAYQLIMGAYAGWTTPVYFSGENVSPDKSIPRALFIGVLLTAAIYLGVNGALLHALGTTGVASAPLPFAQVLKHFGGSLPATLFALTACVTVASCANATIMGASRVIFALSSDGLLPRSLAAINKGGSPHSAFLLSAVLSLALAATGLFGLVFGLIATLNAVAGVLVDMSLFILRRREPHLPRPYRAVLYPLLPAIQVLVDGSLVVLFCAADYVGGLVTLGLGLLCVPLALIARRR
jgi:APA family basic amino acid/polyamine antiporter